MGAQICPQVLLYIHLGKMEVKENLNQKGRRGRITEQILTSSASNINIVVVLKCV